MKLKNWLGNNGVNVDGDKLRDRLNEARNRVIVVGSMTPKTKDTHQVFLFSQRPDAKLRADRLGAKLCALNESELDNQVQPSVVERTIAPKPWEYAPQLKLLAPIDADLDKATLDDLEKGSGGGFSTLGLTHFLVQRTVQNSKIERFQRWHKPQQDESARLITERQGEAIFRHLRKSLKTYARFQPLNPEIIAAFRFFIQESAGESLPMILEGHLLPAGLPHFLLNFLFEDERTERQRSGGAGEKGDPIEMLSQRLLEELDFDIETEAGMENQYTWIKENKEVRNAFAERILVFRAVLLGRNPPAGRSTAGGVGLSNIASMVLDQPRFKQHKLKDNAKACRDALIGIRQVLRSRVLPSYLLHWVIDAAFQVPAVKNLPEAEKNAKLTEMILSSEEPTEDKPFPKAIPRLNQDAFDDLRRDWRANRNQAIQVLFKPASEFETALSELDEPFREPIRAIRKDEKVFGTLRVWARSEGGDEQDRREGLEALGKALTGLLDDLVYPRLTVSPTMDMSDLESVWKTQLLGLSIQALIASNQGARAKFEELGYASQDAFARDVVDEKTGKRKGGSSEKNFEASLLEKVLKAFASDEVAAQAEKFQKLVVSLQELKQLNVPLTGEIPYAAERSAEQDSARAPAMAEKLAESLKAILERPQKVPAKANVEATKDAQASTVQAKEPGHEAGSEGPQSPSSHTPSSKDEDQLASTSPPADDATPPTPQSSSELHDDRSRMEAELLSMFPKLAEPIASDAPETRIDEPIQQAIQQVAKNESRDLLQVVNEMLALVYTQYNDDRSGEAYRANVHQFSMAGIMRSLSGELGLGQEHSFLFRLILDLFEVLQEESPRPLAFLKERTLTRYLKNDKIRAGGIQWLHKKLEEQADQSLRSVSGFTSDVLGLRFLLESLRGSTQHEVILFDGSAERFVAWLKDENLLANAGQVKGLQSTALFADQAPASVASCIFFTPSAFPLGQRPSQWVSTNIVRQNSGLFHSEATNRYLDVPPIIVSYEDDPSPELAASIDRELKQVDTPALALGPGVALGEETETFRPRMSFGFIFLANLLGRPGEITFSDTGNEPGSKGRFHRGWTSSVRDEREVATLIKHGTPDVLGFGGAHFLWVLKLLSGIAQQRPNGRDSKNVWAPFDALRFDGENTGVEFEAWSILLQDALHLDSRCMGAVNGDSRAEQPWGVAFDFGGRKIINFDTLREPSSAFFVTSNLYEWLDRATNHLPQNPNRRALWNPDAPSQ